MNPLAEAEAEAKSPFLGQTEAEAEDSVDHWNPQSYLKNVFQMEPL